MAANIGQLLAIQELKNRGVGIAENIASVGSSWAVEPFAGLTGLAALPLGHERATQAINNMREKFTYQPRSKEGKETQEFIADKSKYLSYPAAGYLGMAELATGQGLDRATQTISQATEEGVESAIGDRAYEITGSPLAASVSSAAPAAVASYFGFKGAPKIGKQYQFGDIKSGGNKQRGTFGGVKAKNANLEMQAAAEELANRGIPPEEIWSQTGWFKGQDGKWRFEISDEKSKWAGRDMNSELGAAVKSGDANKTALIVQSLQTWKDPAKRKSGDMGKIYEHRNLYQNYPDMKKVKVKNEDIGDYGGQYIAQEDSIKLNKDDFRSKKRSTLLHESQHAIQEREGFAKGGSPDNISQKASDTPWLEDARLLKQVTGGDDIEVGLKRFKEYFNREPEIGAESMVLSGKSLSEIKKLEELSKAADAKGLGTPYQQYKRLYGEAEARLVQERMNMTEAERKAYPPMKHMEDMLAKEGIKMDELIVRNDSGKSMSIESQSIKQQQLDKIKKLNPMTDDFHVGIRSVDDIKTYKEAFDDPESFVYPDYSKSDAEKALNSGKVTIYSSKPLDKNTGQFVTPSRMQAADYAGGEKVYSKTVSLDDVAWINGDEGQLVGKMQTPNKSKPMSIEQQMAREELKRRGITAYHGTPHEVDKFSSQYIGTGEGAQAYGHGLYFAESPDVARDYQKTLSDEASASVRYKVDGKTLERGSPEWKAVGMVENDGIAAAKRLAKQYRKDLDAGESYITKDPNMGEEFVKRFEQTVNSYKKGSAQKDMGNLYKVELDIDPDTEMLDWDKPLSEQPKAAQEVILELAKTYRNGATRGGVTLAESEIKRNSSLGEIHKALEGQIDGMGWGKGRPDVIASELNKKGIKGIKYSDQMSRGSEGGTKNFVVFDDNLITIAEKNGVKFEQVEKLAKEKNISKQQALSMLIGGSVGAALWSSGEKQKPDRS